MLLLWGNLLVRFEDLVNHIEIGRDGRLGPGLLLSIAARLDMLKNPLQRVPMQFVLTVSGQLAQFAGELSSANLGTKLRLSVSSALASC